MQPDDDLLTDEIDVDSNDSVVEDDVWEDIDEASNDADVPASCCRLVRLPIGEDAASAGVLASSGGTVSPPGDSTSARTANSAPAESNVNRGRDGDGVDAGVDRP